MFKMWFIIFVYVRICILWLLIYNHIEYFGWDYDKGREFILNRK